MQKYDKRIFFRFLRLIGVIVTLVLKRQYLYINNIINDIRLPFIWKISTGDISATAHPMHFTFGSIGYVGFSGSTD